MSGLYLSPLEVVADDPVKVIVTDAWFKGDICKRELHIKVEYTVVRGDLAGQDFIYRDAAVLDTMLATCGLAEDASDTTEVSTLVGRTMFVYDTDD